MKTIDCTPTWEGLLPFMLDLYAQEANKPFSNSKKQEAFQNMKIEFKRMAQAADNWNAHCKEQNEKDSSSKKSNP